MAMVNAVITANVISSAFLSLRIHDLDILVWLEFIAALGPILSLFLIGILAATFFESKRTDIRAFVIGALCGGLSFFSWLILQGKSH
jgi:hypothetical protein